VVKFNKIGYWSEIKLDIIRDYATEYSKIMKKQPLIREYYYIDGFAGAGLHFSKRTKEFVLGSPTNALNIKPAFSGYHFIDLDGKKVEILRKISAESANVKVYEGDCNEILLNKVLPSIRYDEYK
jgi:three-Cys-motif partner protein